MDIGHSEHIRDKVVYLIIDNMHVLRMYILGLRPSWGTSRVRPSWSSSGHILTPALSPFWGAPVRSHACPEDAVYSLNDSCSCFTQRLFPPSDFSPMYREYLIIIHGIALIHIIHHIHMYIHNLYYTSHSYLYSHLLSFISSALRGRLAALDSLCPIQLVTKWLFSTAHFHWFLISSVSDEDGWYCWCRLCK